MPSGRKAEVVLIADQTWAAGEAAATYWDTDSENQKFAANLYPENNPTKGNNDPTHVNVICLHDFHGPLTAPRNGGYFGDTTGANLALAKCLYESNITFPNADGLRVLERVELTSNGSSVPTVEGYEAGTANLAWITCPRQPPSNTDVENIKTWLSLNSDNRLVISYEYAAPAKGAGATYRNTRQECENVNLLLGKLGLTMQIAEDGTNSSPPQYPITNNGGWKSSKMLSTGQPVSGISHSIVDGIDHDHKHAYDTLQLSGTSCLPVSGTSVSINGPVNGIKFGGISPIDLHTNHDPYRTPKVLMVAGAAPVGGIISSAQNGTKILGMQVELEVETCTTGTIPTITVAACCIATEAQCLESGMPACQPGSVVTHWGVLDSDGNYHSPINQKSYKGEIWNVTKNEIHQHLKGNCSYEGFGCYGQIHYGAGISDSDDYQVKLQFYDTLIADGQHQEDLIAYGESNIFHCDPSKSFHELPCAPSTVTTTTTTTTTTTLPPQGNPAGILLGNIGLAGFGSFTIPGIGPLPPVPPPPYPYPDPSPPEPIPHTPVVVEPSVLHSTANRSNRLILERDLFDPNRKVNGKTKTVQSIATSKGYNLSNYTPYQRTNKGLEKILYSEKIKTGMSVVLVDNNINVEDREKRLLSNIAAREILPARMKWPEE